MTNEQLDEAHRSIDETCNARVDTIPDIADRIMFQTIQRAMMHAILDLGIRHEVNLHDAEIAIAKSIAGMVHAYIASVSDWNNHDNAKKTARDIMIDAMFYALNIIASHFENKVDPDETVH